MTKEKDVSFDFANIFKIIFVEKKILIFSVIISLLLNWFFIYRAKTEYTATGKILPEVAHKSSDGLGGLFEFLKKYSDNVNLYNTEITSPNLYTELIRTKAFYDYLSTKNILTCNDLKINFKEYFKSDLKNRNKFFRADISNLKNDSLINEYNLQQTIQKRIQITVDKKNNIVIVSASMSDPVVASNIANYTIDYLISFITKYRTQKSRQELIFIEELQKNSRTELFSNKIEDNLLASIIQMKIKIQQDTPVFQVLEYAPIPVINNNTSFAITSIGFIISGVLVGIILVLFKNNNYKSVIN